MFGPFWSTLTWNSPLHAGPPRAGPVPASPGPARPVAGPPHAGAPRGDAFRGGAPQTAAPGPATLEAVAPEPACDRAGSPPPVAHLHRKPSMSQSDLPSVPALLFDLDGTLVDTDRLHLEAYNLLLARFGRSIDVDYYKTHVMGFKNEQIMDAMFPDAGEQDKRDYADEKERLVRGLFDRELEPLPGLVELLRNAERAGCPTAIVTNAPRENARLLLAGLGMADRFAIIVYGEELERGKPHPLPYLTGLQLLGASADNAFAFEDSRSGIRAASAAGIRTFGVRTSLTDGQLREAGAFATIQDYRDGELRRHLRGLVGGESGTDAAAAHGQP